MNLYDLLNNYKTNPKEEMRKIFDILNNRGPNGSLWDLFRDKFSKSQFRSYEESLDSFYRNFISNNDEYIGMEPNEKNLLEYRLLCELLLALKDVGSDDDFFGYYDDPIGHLNDVISNGLNRCGFDIKCIEGKEVTVKKDVVAEIVASGNKKYTEDIYDFLIAKTIKEKQNISQSKLVLGYKIDKMTDFELRYVLNVYSYILGGGPDSKLFKTVREKNSLCYYISSISQPLNSILMIKAGINKKDFKKSLSLIKKETLNMKKGKFDDDDIIKAKITYINSLKELEDSQESLLSLYAGIEYLNSDTLEDRFININKVTKADVIKLGSKIHLDTVYLLEGDSNEKE